MTLPVSSRRQMMPFFILAVSPASLSAALRKRAFSGTGLSRTGSFLSSFSESVLFYTLSGKLSGKIGNRRQRGRPLICFHFQVPVLPGSGGFPCLLLSVLSFAALALSRSIIQNLHPGQGRFRLFIFRKMPEDRAGIPPVLLFPYSFAG